MKSFALVLSTCFAVAFTITFTNASYGQQHSTMLFTNATIIDGSGKPPQQHTDMLIQDERIVRVGKHLVYKGAKVVNLRGNTIMPLLISVHSHIGIVKGTTNSAVNYTRLHIGEQLKRYLTYGVGHILSMGTDRPFIFTTGLRDSSMAGLLPGARLHSAGMGFGVPKSAPPAEIGADLVFRPVSPEEVPAQLDSLVQLKPDLVKIWVDDFGGRYKKMDEAVYRTIIDEAHKRNLRVAAHVYYLSDARKLVAAGIDIIGHSIRDSIVDDQLITDMKAKNVVYIPTLSLDEYAYIYAGTPKWMNEPFFKASLEKGVYEMIFSEGYQKSLKDLPSYSRNRHALETALINLKKLFRAGILIALGTDSGAMPVRAQGFSEHLELELMVLAGLTPLEAITVGTKNSALALKIDKNFGMLGKGKIADLMILRSNPAANIQNTHTIIAVYKAGTLVSNGPIENNLKPIDTRVETAY